MIWSVQPLLGGEFGPVRSDIIYQGGDPSERDMVPSILFCLRDEKGRYVIVDTSFADVEEVRAMGLIANRERPLPELLELNGIQPEKVDALLLTHTHWDHAGNCGLFANARIYCQKRDWDYAFAPEGGYAQGLLDSLNSVRDRVTFIDGDGEIFPGIRAVLFGGHTPGSQAFLVDTAQGTALVCGDDLMTFRNAEERLPVGLCVNPEGCRRAADYAGSCEFTYLLPSHDYRTLEAAHI